MERMNIIMISTEMPYPANTGGRIVVYKRLQYLSQRNNIYFFCIVDNTKEIEYKCELENYCKEVHLYNRHTITNKLKTIFSLYKGPLACVSRCNKEMSRDMLSCYLNREIDKVIVEFPQMLGNVSDCMFADGKVVLEQHNIEHVTMSNLAGSIKSPLRSLIFRFEATRLKQWEEKYYKKNISLYTFVSSEDKAFFETWKPQAKTHHSPIGAEVNIADKSKIEPLSIMYFGKMAYSPNAEAVKWFAEEVFEGIQKNYPTSKFYIVGKDPLPFLKELPQNNHNVIVTGTVDSVKEYYERANIVIVPLSHGGGVKVKVLEALGYGKLVISTKKGIEGTDFEGGKELLTAETPEEFINLVDKVFTNPSDFERVQNQGLKSIEDKYTWNAIISDFESKL